MSFAFNPNLGYVVQRDLGGPLHVVDLATGADTVLVTPLGTIIFRRPALSPSGKRLVVEAYADRVGDLWEFSLP